VVQARGVFGQLALDGGGALVEHLERTPAGAVARHRVGGEELSVRIAGEVDAGVAAVIQVGELEAVDGRQVGLVEGEGGLRRGRGHGRRFGRIVPAAGGQGEGHGKGKQQQAWGGCAQDSLRDLWTTTASPASVWWHC